MDQDQTLNPRALARAVMQHLPDSSSRLSCENKQFWLEFAEELGTDWIDEWKRVGDFMGKTDEF